MNLRTRDAHPLRLVDGQGPAQLQWQLFSIADPVGTHVLEALTLHLHHASVVKLDTDPIVMKLNHNATTAVDKPILALQPSQEDHLRLGLQPQVRCHGPVHQLHQLALLCRWDAAVATASAESVLAPEDLLLAWQCLQLPVVLLIDVAVGAVQTGGHDAFRRQRLCRNPTPAAEIHDHGRALARTHIIQHLDKGWVSQLPHWLLQDHCTLLQLAALPGGSLKAKGPPSILITACIDGWQLQEVPAEQDLHAAKALAPVSPELTSNVLKYLKEVRLQHGNLIDYKHMSVAPTGER
mmetsp:Transcript_36862/g.85782  ORF Transcript_36862/g.85782 Transcript_36862/m.85782 type:complete len:294 (-) Transcript_36862:190-1071(-)